MAIAVAMLGISFAILLAINLVCPFQCLLGRGQMGNDLMPEEIKIEHRAGYTGGGSKETIDDLMDVMEQHKVGDQVTVDFTRMNRRTMASESDPGVTFRTVIVADPAAQEAANP